MAESRAGRRPFSSFTAMSDLLDPRLRREPLPPSSPSPSTELAPEGPPVPPEDAAPEPDDLPEVGE
eukprot:841304-Pyramimonas_sp.AAC.1